MRSIRRRKEIRALVRKAKGRPQPAAPAQPAAPTRPQQGPETGSQEFFCRCGKILRVTPADCNQDLSCPACLRKMIVHRVGGPGMEVLRPVFHEEVDSEILEGQLLAESDPVPNPDQDDTEALTAIVATVEIARGEGALDDAIEPEPPKEIFFFCPGCRAKLVAGRKLYDRRARCSRCATRVLINLIFDRATKRFDVRLLRLGDPSSGNTSIVPALP